jgi:hypothetical protein
VIKKGHAFSIIVDPKTGQQIPVECTAIGGAGIGGTRTFAEAVKRGEENLKLAMQEGFIQILDVQTLQNKGIRPPELPAIDMKMVQETLAKRLETRAPARPQERQNAFTHPQGFFSFEYPETMIARPDVAKQLQQVAPWFLFIAADNAGNSVEVYHLTRINDAEDAVKQVQAACRKLNGQFNVRAGTPISAGPYRGMKYEGESVFGPNRSSWTSLFLQTRQGVVGIVVSGPDADANLNQIIGTLMIQ